MDSERSNPPISTGDPSSVHLLPMPPLSLPSHQDPAEDSNSHTLIQYSMMQEMKNLPRDDEFFSALATWQWATIDGVRLPCVFRDNVKFLSNHMVQTRLLTRFPSALPPDIVRRYSMTSYKMLILEAWILNTVNAVDCKFEFGYRLYTPNDELVRLRDVERFYHAVRAYHLVHISDLYNREANTARVLHPQMASHITSLKSNAEAEFRALLARADAESVESAGDDTPLSQEV